MHRSLVKWLLTASECKSAKGHQTRRFNGHYWVTTSLEHMVCYYEGTSTHACALDSVIKNRLRNLVTFLSVAGAYPVCESQCRLGRCWRNANWVFGVKSWRMKWDERGFAENFVFFFKKNKNNTPLWAFSTGGFSDCFEAISIRIVCPHLWHCSL